MMYTEGYKYRTELPHTVLVPFAHLLPQVKMYDNGYLWYSKSGYLVINKGYSWDGPSGPVVDTPCNMYPSLIHDAWYQLLREGAVPSYSKKLSDEWFGELCVERGTWRWVAAGYVAALKMYGHDAATKKRPRLEML